MPEAAYILKSTLQVISHSNCTRALTFENMRQASRGGAAGGAKRAKAGGRKDSEGVALSAEERAARAKAAAEEVVCVCVCVCPCVSVCVRVSVFASLLTQECTRVVHTKKTGTIHI